MKDELQIDSKYLHARRIAKRIQDISFTIAQLERKYPGNEMTSERKGWMANTYIAFYNDLKDIAKQLEDLKDE